MPDPAPIRGRWTIYARRDTGALAYGVDKLPSCLRGYYEPVEVVPVPDEAAIERGAKYLEEWDLSPGDGAEDYRAVALAVLRAAVETPDEP